MRRSFLPLTARQICSGQSGGLSSRSATAKARISQGGLLPSTATRSTLPARGVLALADRLPPIFSAERVLSISD